MIDWSKAPDGATHWDAGSVVRVAGWMRLDDNQWYWWPVTETDCEMKWYATSRPQPLATFIARPKWSGEGLPTVGTVCEYHVGNGPWFKGEIRYLISPIAGQPKEVVLFATHLKEERVGVIGDGEGEVSFRPIRTPEQIAAEERDEASYELASFVAGYYGKQEPNPDSIKVAGYLYDQGYRRQPTNN